MALHFTTYLVEKDARFRYSCSPEERPKSLEERKRLFSSAARALVAEMLDGVVEIHPEDIRLEIESPLGGGIFINERIGKDPVFRKLLAETACISKLKILAKMALMNFPN